MSISYYYNVTRFGLMVLLLHDVGDIFLYSAKAVLYKKKQSLADGLFGLFAATFFISRIVLFPLICVIPTATLFASLVLASKHSLLDQIGMLTLPAMLILLFFVQCFWWLMIWKMIQKTLVHKTIEKDSRSDTEQDDKDD